MKNLTWEIEMKKKDSRFSQQKIKLKFYLEMSFCLFALTVSFQMHSLGQYSRLKSKDTGYSNVWLGGVWALEIWKCVAKWDGVHSRGILMPQRFLYTFTLTFLQYFQNNPYCEQFWWIRSAGELRSMCIIIHYHPWGMLLNHPH